MTKYRAKEFLAVVDAMVNLNERNIDELDELGLDFRGRLKKDEIHYMGHSYGGATALQAGRLQRPASIIAHEPAAHWAPDETRASLVDKDRMKDMPVNYANLEINLSNVNEDLTKSASIHDYGYDCSLEP